MFVAAATPAFSASLLGIVGDQDSGALVTLGSGSASDSGTVNVGAGSGGVDVKIGGSSLTGGSGGTLVHTGLSTTGESDLNLDGGQATALIGLGGLGGLTGGANGNDGTNGVDGVGGTNGVNGVNGVSGVNGSDGVFHYQTGLSSRLDDLTRLIHAAEWQRLAKQCNISVETVKAKYWLNRDERQYLPSLITQNASYIGSMQNKLASDPSYSCIASQAGVDASRIIAVDYQRDGKVLLLVV